jgi:hypothetical protein
VQATSSSPTSTGWRPADFEAVQDCLALLARAVHYFNTYPATSPFCSDAIAAIHAALVALTSREQLAFRGDNQHNIKDIPCKDYDLLCTCSNNLGCFSSYATCSNWCKQ